MCAIPKKFFIEEDILLVHKPVGISSFGLVAKMRKVCNTRKIGHSGTLDPLASGLMILGINAGTKKLKNYLGLDKVYRADILIGRSTTTGDVEGNVIEEKFYRGDLSRNDIERALEKLLGEHFFPAPQYSAVKVLGKALYRYAREGKEPPFIPEKKLHLKDFQILDFHREKDFLFLQIRVSVGSGTYIRTLAEQCGKNLGYPASLTALSRESIGEYSFEDAYVLPDV